MTKQRIPYAEALPKAEALVRILQPACERIIIAGSLRRKCETIGDIEIVAIPLMDPIRNLFGEVFAEESLVDRVLNTIDLRLQLNGKKYKKFDWQEMSCDLFLARRATWGMIATIRTGSADFSHWLMTSSRLGGALPEGMQASGGLLWQDGRLVVTEEEEQVFAAIGLDWIPPEKRTEGRWR